MQSRRMQARQSSTSLYGRSSHHGENSKVAQGMMWMDGIPLAHRVKSALCNLAINLTEPEDHAWERGLIGIIGKALWFQAKSGMRRIEAVPGVELQCGLRCPWLHDKSAHQTGQRGSIGSSQWQQAMTWYEWDLAFSP
jgi:hypothetical protein